MTPIDPGVLLAIVGFLVGGVLFVCGYWVWLDAKERAEDRRHQSAMAEARVQRWNAARDEFYADRDRYLTSDDRRPE